MRAQARTSFRALTLILLLLASTQMVLLTARDYTHNELERVPQRFDADNSGVANIALGDDHACAIGTNNKMKCWGAGENGKTGHENVANYGSGDNEMGR